jgi:hypothetical protein
MEDRPQSGLLVSVDVFDKYAKDVLTVDWKLNGKTERICFLRDLILDGDGLVNYNGLLQRLEKMPGMVAFYGVSMDQAVREVEEAQEEFDQWYAEVSGPTQTTMIANIQNQTIAAGLKKTPTMADVENQVRVTYKTLWEEKKGKIRKAKELASMLTRVCKGMETAANMLQSEVKLVMLLWDKGVEEIRAKLPVRK